MAPANLLIFGASARAAAFSALRAGLEPWCVDLFVDLDLIARCPAMSLPSGHYPDGLLDLLRLDLPAMPWMYTGGLENRPALIAAIARQRPLWGNGAEMLPSVRRPEEVAAVLRSRATQVLYSCLTLDGKNLITHLLRRQGYGVPDVWSSWWGKLPRQGRWLLKPRSSAGGVGIRSWTGSEPRPNLRRHYLQEHIEGEPCAAIYVGSPGHSQFFGVTRQLVGEPWLHAGRFHYCGSIGPLPRTAELREAFEQIGTTLVLAFVPRGLFGVDCILRDGIPYPVEVNPRYTASVEVLEHAIGTPALALHRRVFQPDAPEPVAGPIAAPVIGKAILFARQALTFPADGPWMTTLRQPGDIWALPAFADIPAAGTPIKAGRPVLTFFARGQTVEGCREDLQRIAAELDRVLYRCG